MVAVGNRGRISPVSSLTQKAPRLSIVGGLFVSLDIWTCYNPQHEHLRPRNQPHRMRQNIRPQTPPQTPHRNTPHNQSHPRHIKRLDTPPNNQNVERTRISTRRLRHSDLRRIRQPRRHRRNSPDTTQNSRTRRNQPPFMVGNQENT